MNNKDIQKLWKTAKWFYVPETLLNKETTISINNIIVHIEYHATNSYNRRYYTITGTNNDTNETTTTSTFSNLDFELTEKIASIINILTNTTKGNNSCRKSKKSQNNHRTKKKRH